MTENRFKLHITWYNKEKTEGEAELTDNGQPILCTEYIYDARLLKNLLNELHEENQTLKDSVISWSKSYNRVYEENEYLKQLIKGAYNNERTDLGKSVLKQLIEAIQ